MSDGYDIRVYDDLVPESLADDISKFIINYNSWSYIISPYSFWESKLGKNYLDNGITEVLYDFINENIFLNTLQLFHLNDNVENKNNDGYPNIYLNGQTVGQDGDIHQDSTETNTFTLLYYPIPLHQNINNSHWQYNWGGELNFYGGNDIVKSVLPIPNRLVIFDSTIFHRANAPSKYFDGGLRISMAYKCFIQESKNVSNKR